MKDIEHIGLIRPYNALDIIKQIFLERKFEQSMESGIAMRDDLVTQVKEKETRLRDNQRLNAIHRKLNEQRVNEIVLDQMQMYQDPQQMPYPTNFASNNDLQGVDFSRDYNNEPAIRSYVPSGLEYLKFEFDDQTSTSVEQEIFQPPISHVLSTVASSNQWSNNPQAYAAEFIQNDYAHRQYNGQNQRGYQDQQQNQLLIMNSDAINTSQVHHLGLNDRIQYLNKESPKQSRNFDAMSRQQNGYRWKFMEEDQFKQMEQFIAANNSQKRKYQDHPQGKQIDMHNHKEILEPVMAINQHQEGYLPHIEKRLIQKNSQRRDESRQHGDMPFQNLNRQYGGNNHHQQIKIVKRTPQPGKAIAISPWNRYKVDYSRILGSGTFSKVYLGYDIENRNKKLAIKVIDLQKCDFRFEDEIRLARMIDSQFIIKILDYWVTKNNKQCYLVLEYCDGGSLADVVSTIRKDEALKYFSQIMSGMNELWKRKILHRDLKLENILLLNNTVKISDFGLARRIDSLFGLQSIRCGTPLTMAPEVLFGGNVVNYNIKCDIWSLGIILHQLYYHQHPFNENLDLIMRNQRIRTIQSEPIVDDFINKCLQYDQNQRLSWPQALAHPIAGQQSIRLPEHDNRIIESRDVIYERPVEVQERRPMFHRKIDVQSPKRNLKFRKVVSYSIVAMIFAIYLMFR